MAYNEAVGVAWRVFFVGVAYYFWIKECFGWVKGTFYAILVIKAEQLLDLIGTLGFEK